MDNDFNCDVSFVEGTALTVDEAAGTLTTTVRVQTPGDLSAVELLALNENVVVTASTADGTAAAAGQDYTALSAQTLTFAPSSFSEIDDCVSNLVCLRAEMTVEAPITNDAVHEGATPETFTLTLSHGSGQRIAYASGETATVSITDNDAAPTLSVAVSAAMIAEAAGSSTVTVGTGGSTFTTDQMFPLALSGTATKGDGYTISAESPTLTAGASPVAATLGVDWACARCLFGIALSQTRIEATHGAGGVQSGDLESTITGLYPCFSAQLGERLSVWAWRCAEGWRSSTCCPG